MNESVQEFSRLFWISLVASIFYGIVFFILVRRRHLWLRFMDAEESFWSRFGFRKGGFTRRFGESRFFTVSMAFFSVVLLFLAVISAVSYFHFQHLFMQLHR